MMDHITQFPQAAALQRWAQARGGALADDVSEALGVLTAWAANSGDTIQKPVAAAGGADLEDRDDLSDLVMQIVGAVSDITTWVDRWTV
jgi:hypothetical protein